ncbi:MAG: tetratricopeptide repeat protein [Saprospiraceae bacterium]
MFRLSKVISFSISFLCFNASYSQQSFCKFTPEIKAIYNTILQLDLEQAKVELGNKPIKDPNKAYLLLENSIDFYKYFILEETPDLEASKKQKELRLRTIEIAALPIEWSRFLKAELLLQWAMIHVKQGDFIIGFQNFREAVSLLEANVEQYPDFKYSYKSLGVLHALLAGIPESFKWAAQLIGLKGHLVTGKEELQGFIMFAETNQDLFLEEAYGAMSFLISYLENKPEQGYNYWIKKMGLKEPNPLYAFVQSRLAIRANYNDAAINILQSLPIEERNKLPYLHFLLGLVKLQKLDVNAEPSFKFYLQQYKGQSHLKECYQKLAWSSLIHGNRALYHLYISKCLTQGIQVSDEDKQAYLEASRKQKPDSILLRARLLCDGAYVGKAWETLLKVKDDYYKNPVFQLECAYRLGRIFQLKKEYAQALIHFEDAVHFDLEERTYMSCNALLQMGLIKEALNQKNEARTYFKSVLDRKPDQYQRSMQQKAKSGLSRLN